MYDLSYIIDCFVIAVALSIDAAIVSFSQGLIFQKGKWFAAIVLAFFVGFFQFFMPFIGWFGANFVHSYIESAAKWIGVSIFLLLGIKIIIEALKTSDSEECECKQSDAKLSLHFLIAVSIATSIDALGAGVSFNLLNKAILFPAILIGIITFINSLIGFWCGCCFKKANSKIPQFCAGIILILLAIKNFYL